MSTLQYWEEKIKEKSKHLSFRNFSKQILSWSTFVFHRNSGMISKFPQTQRVSKVVKSSEFDEKNTKILDEGVLYNGNFFGDYTSLFSQLELPNMMHFYGFENSEYSDIVAGGKNTYLSSGIITDCENVLYSCSIKDASRNVFGSVMVWDTNENIYECSGIIKSYNVFYSNNIDTSSNIWFSSNLVGCTECILCDSLTNQSYIIANIQYSEEEYTTKKTDLLSRKKIFQDLRAKVGAGKNLVSENCTGENIISSQSIENGKFVYHVNNGRNLILVGSKGDNSEEYSISSAGSPYGSHFYSGYSLSGENLYCSCHVALSSNVYYSYFLTNCSFCLGCIGLKNKSFCILNKQYTKEEWYELANKIFEQMDKDGTLGDFFPGSLNPFYFNDTMAYLIDDSFTKEEVEAEGYMWRDEAIRVDIPEGVEVVKSSELGKYQGFGSLPVKGGADEEGGSGGFVVGNQNPPDLSQSQTNLPPFTGGSSWYIDPEIMKKVIVDEKGNYYKIVPMEYDFLMKHSLPLPEIHWLERIKMGFRFSE